MPEPVDTIAHWVTDQRPGAVVWELRHPDHPSTWPICLVISGLNGEASAHRAEAWAMVGEALRSGGFAESVLVGNGGRTGLGAARVRQAVAWLSLEAVGYEFRDQVGVRWLDAPPDQKYRDWAAPHGVAFDDEPPAEVVVRTPPPTADPGLTRAPRSAETNTLKAWEWHIRPGEDALVHEYWAMHGGHLWCEVGLPNDMARPIDAVWCEAPERSFGGNVIDYDTLGDRPLSVIEAKRHLHAENAQGRGNIDNLVGQVLTAQAAVAHVLAGPSTRSVLSRSSMKYQHCLIRSARFSASRSKPTQLLTSSRSASATSIQQTKNY